MELKIDYIAGLCPVQSEGTINGEAYYFRARGGGWRFEVGGWEYYEKYGDGPFDAGYMSEEEAKAFIEQAASIYAGDYTP